MDQKTNLESLGAKLGSFIRRYERASENVPQTHYIVDLDPYNKTHQTLVRSAAVWNGEYEKPWWNFGFTSSRELLADVVLRTAPAAVSNFSEALDNFLISTSPDLLQKTISYNPQSDDPEDQITSIPLLENVIQTFEQLLMIRNTHLIYAEAALEAFNEYQLERQAVKDEAFFSFMRDMQSRK